MYVGVWSLTEIASKNRMVHGRAIVGPLLKQAKVGGFHYHNKVRIQKIEIVNVDGLMIFERQPLGPSEFSGSRVGLKTVLATKAAGGRFTT